MNVMHNGTLRTKRPQLSDSISRLDEMVDGLAIAIPGAVADSMREILGPAFSTAIKEAVKEAVAEVLKSQNREEAKPMPVEPPAAPPTPPAPRLPRVDRWIKVKAALRRLKNWVQKKAAPVIARAALGWAVVRTVGGATVHSRTSTLITALTGTAAGFGGFILGPVGAAVLLGVATGMIAATTVWAAPAARLMIAMQEA